MKTFNLPDLGEGLQEAEIVSWHVKEGDVVKVDQPLLSVETAKAVVDVPSPWAGRIAKLHGKAGDIIPTHSALVDFDIEGGGAPAKKEEAAAQKATPDAKKGTPIAEDSGTVVGNVPTSNAVVAETAIIRKKQKQEPQRVKALPSVRILAKQMGVDLSGIPPTGKNDTVSADDVRNAAGGRAAAPTSATHSVKWDIPKPRNDVKYGVAEPLRGPRRAMHASMTRSRSEVAECTLFDDADIHNWQSGQDVTVRIVRAIVAGCRAEP